MAPRERIEDIIERIAEPLAAQIGYELVEVEYRKEGPDWVLRCFIDSPSGVGVDECQHFSEAIEKLLDEADPIPGSYLLEVSSPGIERPLKKDRDFQRFTGEIVEIKLHKPLDGQKIFQGELFGFIDSEPEKIVQIKLKQGQIIEIQRTDIAKAHIIAEIFGSKGGRKKK